MIQMLNGELDPVAAKKWAWDRSNEGAACGIYDPGRDLKDVSGYTE